MNENTNGIDMGNTGNTYRQHTNCGSEKRMLMYEELARARIRDAHRFAARERLATRLCAARRWRRLANWADNRARISARAL